MRNALPAITFVAGVALALGGAWIMRPAPEPAPAIDRPLIEDIVASYLETNPDAVIAAIRTYQEREQAAEAERRRESVLSAEDVLNRDPADPVIGNPDGDVTLVEFFDYRCGYCKQVAEQVASMVDDDPELRIVFKEFPILGAESEFASRAALASRMQNPDAYLDFHLRLMQATRVDQASVMEIAADLGLDLDRLRADMEAPEIDAHLERVFDLAGSLGIRGTPAFVVGGDVIPGAVPESRLQQAIEQAREEG